VSVTLTHGIALLGAMGVDYGRSPAADLCVRGGSPETMR